MAFGKAKESIMKAITKNKPVEGEEWATGFQLIEKPIPAVESPNDVIIKVFAGAICGTDVGIYNAKESLRVEMSRALISPVTVGHEFSGRIVDAGLESAEAYCRNRFCESEGKFCGEKTSSR